MFVSRWRSPFPEAGFYYFLVAYTGSVCCLCCCFIQRSGSRFRSYDNLCSADSLRQVVLNLIEICYIPKASISECPLGVIEIALLHLDAAFSAHAFFVLVVRLCWEPWSVDFLVGCVVELIVFVAVLVSQLYLSFWKRRRRLLALIGIYLKADSCDASLNTSLTASPGFSVSRNLLITFGFYRLRLRSL